ncbi:MAG: 6-hydroxymethylpterin diphosphokinase MptE-like protein [Candidatus Hodarchaeales archaeon]|jgi:uncharacterized Rossmann fold enzyme
MRWSDWKNSYTEIVKELKLDLNADRKTSDWLEEYFSNSPAHKKHLILQKLRYIFENPVIIAGAGPSLENDLLLLMESSLNLKLNFIAINGATTLFKTKNIVPTAVISDLDGDLSAIKWAIENGALTLIHAHGDNRNIVYKFLNEFHHIILKSDVWGTTQCKPKNILFNFGGFTDGDRAIFIGFHFQSPMIGLIGFDFGSEIGYYSYFNSPITKNKQFKIKKFKIALNLISKFYSSHTGQRFNLSSKGQKIIGFPKVDLSVFLNQLAEYYR